MHAHVTCACCHVYFTFPSHWERKHFKVSECRGTAGAAAEILGDGRVDRSLVSECRVRAHCEHSHGAHSFLYFTLSFGEVPCNYMYIPTSIYSICTRIGRRRPTGFMVEASRAERAAPAFATSYSSKGKLRSRCTLPYRPSQVYPAVAARRAAP